MNRAEFMRQLEILLQNIPPAEREEALQYYNDYFNDAGPENEQTVISALGTPARVAENIKRDLYGNGGEEFAGEQSRVAPGAQMIKYQGDLPKEKDSRGGGDGEDGKLSTGMVVLIVVLCVVASPALFGLASGLLGLLAGAAAAWFGAILGFGVAAVVLLVVMLALLVSGFVCMFYAPVISMLLLGAGLLCGGLGLLFLILTVAMAGIATPGIIRGIVRLWHSVFKKRYA